METSETRQLQSSASDRIKKSKILPSPITVKWMWAAILAFIMLATGCISIPEENWIVSQRNPFEIKKLALDCALIFPTHPPQEQPDLNPKTLPQATPETGLNAEGFSFSTWNIRKGKTKGWDADFHTLCRSTDILILQEAYLSANLKKILQQEDLQWDLVAAYAYQKIEAGVLTASKVAPNLACSLRDKEPITRIPKSILITRYPISGKHRELLVANFHGINFTMGYTAFQEQCDRLESIMATHKGPMIVSGDFNTWSRNRMSRVDAMAKRLNLSPVPFNENLKSTFFGQYVDHVYYRELEMKSATALIVATSDHNPLTVVFKLAEESGHDI
jgi:endonuclease/exonuclease/phosphatase (EEP) superfamily protein YafD